MRDRLWICVCALLLEQPHLRTTLTIPTAVHERWWGRERWEATSTWPGSRARMQGELPMNRPGLRQQTLKPKPVRWEWVLR